VQSTLLLDKKVVTTKILPKITSDHKPILLQLDEEEDLGPIPFKFIPQWIEQEGFMEVVTKAWSTPVIGSPSFVWEQKLKATKSALKEWVKSPSNPYSAKRKEVVQQLADFQMDMESQDITIQRIGEGTSCPTCLFQSFQK
jgi:hypothetical protein